jgi:hypothetical protein
MDLPIYQWLRNEEYGRWVCPHLGRLLAEVAEHGTVIQAVGLVNYKAPEAVVFLSGPFPEQVAISAAKANPTLQLCRNGVGELHSIQCAEHYVSVRCSPEQAALPA